MVRVVGVPVCVPVWYAKCAGLVRISALGQVRPNGLQVTEAEQYKRRCPRGGIGRRA